MLPGVSATDDQRAVPRVPHVHRAVSSQRGRGPRDRPRRRSRHHARAPLGEPDSAEQRVTGLLGPSGSGKTTLMRAIVGVQVIRRGSVDVLGSPAGSPELRRRVGYMTQAPSVYGDLTPRENLAYFARVVGAEPGRVDEVLRIVDLGARADPSCAQALRRRAIARLARERAGRASWLLVLDEPTVGLDPVLRRDLWRCSTVLPRRARRCSSRATCWTRPSAATR